MWKGFEVLFVSVYPSLTTLLPLLKISVSVRHRYTARHRGIGEGRPCLGKGNPWVKGQTVRKCCMTLRKHISL